MDDLPIAVSDAIRRTVGRSRDQAWKAEHDARVLQSKYHLPPEQWNSLHFHRMAQDSGWSQVTEQHRWGIFKRLIDALHVTVGPVPIEDTPVATPRESARGAPPMQQRIEPVRPDIPTLACEAVPPSASETEIVSAAQTSLQAGMVFHWEQVRADPAHRFEFPGDVTAYMRREYAGPAIYRWVVFDLTIGDRKEMYVGEAEDLCRRITQYLQPGPSQLTNKRLHALFQSYRAQGHSVTIQRLRFESLSLGEFDMSQTDLFSKHTRVFIEHMLVTYYSKAGFVLING